MKNKLRNLKALLLYIWRMEPMVLVHLFLRVLVSALLPFAQLILSAQVISWLMEGLAIETYALNLAMLLGGVTLLEIAEREYNYYFEAKRDTLRLNQIISVFSHYLNLDYATQSSPSGQEAFQKAGAMTGSPAYLFGRFMDDLHMLLSATLGLGIYFRLLKDLESSFALIILVLLIGMLVFKYFGQKLNEKIIPELTINNKKYNYTQRVFKDNRLIKDIKMYKMKAWLRGIRASIDEEYLQKYFPFIKLQAGENFFFAVGMLILTATAITRAVYLITQQQLIVSDFILYVGSITLIARVLMNFINGLDRMNKDLTEYDEMVQFMTIEGKDRKEPSEYPLLAPYVIEFQDMSYHYPQNERATLKNINLTIEPGEKIAIVGENGAGKTTLMKLLLGLLEPTEGDILINGKPQDTYNTDDYFSLFSPIFQDSYLLTYTIKDTIIQGLPFDAEHYNKVLKTSGMDKVIENLEQGDETHIVRALYPDAVNLSGGQLQKLRLAQALYKDGAILILDEPTAALDPLAEHQVYMDFADMSQNKTTFFVSHRLASTHFCDRIIYLKQGQVTEMGTHEELMALGEDYYRLYEAQAYYYRQEEAEEEEVEIIIEQGGVI